MASLANGPKKQKMYSDTPCQCVISSGYR